MYLSYSNKEIEPLTEHQMNIFIIQIYLDLYKESLSDVIFAKADLGSKIKKKEINIKLFSESVCEEWIPEKDENVARLNGNIKNQQNSVNKNVISCQELLQMLKYALNIFQDEEIKNRIIYKKPSFISDTDTFTEKQMKISVLEHFRIELESLNIKFFVNKKNKENLEQNYKDHQYRVEKDIYSGGWCDEDDSRYLGRAEKLEETLKNLEIEKYYAKERYKYILEKII